METRPGRVYCFGIERLRHPDCFAAIGAIDDDEVGPASQPHPLPADFAAANQWQASNAKLPSPLPFFALFFAERRPKTVSRSRGGYCGRIGGDICQCADKSGFPLVSGRENWEIKNQACFVSLCCQISDFFNRVKTADIGESLSLYCRSCERKISRLASCLKNNIFSGK